MDLDKIRENYSQMSDSKLERIALNQISDMNPEVQEIVKSEILRRGLNENLITGIEAQNVELTKDELLRLMEKIKKLACPKCGTKDGDLVGGVIKKVRSVIIMTSYEERPIIVCKNCRDDSRKRELIKNSLLGWWGIPYGLFYRTPKTLIMHFIDSTQLDEISEQVIKNFCIQNVGEVNANWEDEEDLLNLVQFENEKL